MTAGRSDDDAKRALDRVGRESDVLGTSALVRGARRPEDENDAAIRWGKRVGRSLSVLLAAALVWWLGIQLGYWPPP